MSVCAVHESGQVDLYFYGELEPAEAAAIDAHLRGCSQCRQALEVDPEPGIGSSLDLVPDVNLGRRIMSDEHDPEPGRPAAPAREAGDEWLHLLLHLCGKRLSVQRPCRHAATTTSSALTLLERPDTTISSPA